MPFFVLDRFHFSPTLRQHRLFKESFSLLTCESLIFVSGPYHYTFSRATPSKTIKIIAGEKIKNEHIPSFLFCLPLSTECLNGGEFYVVQSLQKLLVFWNYDGITEPAKNVRRINILACELFN